MENYFWISRIDGFAYRESINKSLKEIRKEPKKH